MLSQTYKVKPYITQNKSMI